MQMVYSYLLMHQEIHGYNNSRKQTYTARGPLILVLNSLAGHKCSKASGANKLLCFIKIIIDKIKEKYHSKCDSKIFA